MNQLRRRSILGLPIAAGTAAFVGWLVEQARAFAKRALDVVNAGRPPCPLCSLPLDPEGHVCPRQNGYRRGA